MNIEIIAYGIAKDIINGGSMSMAIGETTTVGAIRNELLQEFPAFEGLASLKLAVNAEYVNDEYVLQENDEVVIIPPVSGG